MTTNQKTLHGEDGPSDDHLRIWHHGVSVSGLSYEQAQRMWPTDMESDRIRGWLYLAQDGHLEDGLAHAFDHPLAVHWFISEGASFEEAIAFEKFDADEEVPIETLRAFAPADEWNHYDPANLSEHVCQSCGDSFWYGEVPGNIDGETYEGFVSEDGRFDEEAWATEDPGAYPFYAGESDDVTILCSWCRDSLLDHAKVLTISVEGACDQVLVYEGYVDRSYNRAYTDARLFQNEAFDAVRYYAGATEELRLPTCIRGEWSDEQDDPYVKVKGLSKQFVTAILEGEFVPPFPVLLVTNSVDVMRYTPKAAYVPEYVQRSFKEQADRWGE